jgi:hypothetical protein
MKEGLKDPAISAAGPTHLFVAKDNTATTVQSYLERKTAPILTALEVDMVPLNNKDCPWGEEQRSG